MIKNTSAPSVSFIKGAYMSRQRDIILKEIDLELNSPPGTLLTSIGRFYLFS